MLKKRARKRKKIKQRILMTASIYVSIYVLSKKAYAVQGIDAVPSPAQTVKCPIRVYPQVRSSVRKPATSHSVLPLVLPSPRSASKRQVFTYFLAPEAGIVPYDRPGLIVLSLVFSGSTSPKTNSRCSPSPSRSLIARIRTGSLKM